MSAKHGWILCCAAIWLTAGSGCATKSLKESNQRLRESNDRLIAENNRLEADLLQIQQELAAGRSVAQTEAAPAPSAPQAHSDADLLPGMDGVFVDPVRDGVRITLEDRVFFAPGQAKLSSSGQSKITRVAQVIGSRYPDRVIRVEGHTDDTGTSEYNVWLSDRRAKNVMDMLIRDHGISPEQIKSIGFGEEHPRADNATREGRESNRRVELVLRGG